VSGAASAEAPRPRGWRAAWAVGPNLRGLLAAPPGRLAPLDGLRAIAVLWVVAFHGVLFLGPHVPAAELPGLVAHPLAHLALQGDLGVDLFFVLSGFLIARMLLAERERSGAIALPRFWWRRVLRLVPAYWAALALVALLFPVNIHTAWTNLLYLNNFVSFSDAFMGWAWSLAIEEQFYVVAPLLLVALGAPRAWHAGVFAGLAALGLLARAWALGDLPAAATLVPFAPPWLADQVHDPAFVAYWDALYTKPDTRGGALAVGVVAAYVARMPGAMTAIAGRGASTALLLAGLALMVAPALVPRLGVPGQAPPLAPAWSAAYLVVHHHAFALGTAAVLLAAVAGASAGPAARLAAVLGHAAWRPVAGLSYAAYLVNPLAAGALYALAAPRLGAPAASVPAWALASAALTFVLALALHLAVERPFMRLRD
jgi:peptidoglycan/LPS O-acetylase OafA/YrhL